MHPNRKITVSLSFTSLALRTVIDPEIKSSTYSSLRFTTSGSFSSQLLRCASMTPPRRKGEEVSPKNVLVNRRVVKGDVRLDINGNALHHGKLLQFLLEGTLSGDRQKQPQG